MNSTDARQTPATAGIDWQSSDVVRRIARRHVGNRLFHGLGLLAIVMALALLGLLVVSLITLGAQAFRQTHVSFEVYVDPARIDADNPFEGNYRALVQDAFAALFPAVESRRDLRALQDIPTRGAAYMLRDQVVANPDLIGKTFSLRVAVSDPFDQLAKGGVDRAAPETDRRVSDQEIAWFDGLVAQGRISRPFNWALFTAADSRFPELAGLKGAVIGSAYALLVCFLLSFPIGVAAAVYLEEFASKNRWTDLIEVNINNLAAVPSIVFGLLGLAVFITIFGLPRSSPLVGGMVLALMTLPTIIIVGRASLKAVPPSIREAALGVGASRHQVVLHHVLPLALPGLLTGLIIGLARALGETAPLLLIGMNAFLTAAPDGITSPATALPTQIFMWADSPERGFLARTAAAILVLLGFLVIMNSVAMFLRWRFEKRW